MQQIKRSLYKYEIARILGINRQTLRTWVKLQFSQEELKNMRWQRNRKHTPQTVKTILNRLGEI